MKVRARTRGHYKRRIKEGEVFEFTPRPRPEGHEGEWKGDKPGAWMEPVEDSAPETADPVPPEPPIHPDDLEAEEE